MAKKYTITFGGDTSLGDYYMRSEAGRSIKMRLENEPASFFEGVRPLVEGSSHLILNLETVLADNPRQVYRNKRYPNYDSPDRTLKVLRELGVTAVCLANNHSMDFGADTLLDTAHRLERAGINSFGAGADIRHAEAPLKIKLGGRKSAKTVFIFAGLWAAKRYWEQYHFFAGRKKSGVCPLEVGSLKNRIQTLRSSEPGALIIVCPHWQGRDYKVLPAKIQKLCRQLIAAGANYILAHGTHMLNPMERKDKGIIAYSIGNFVFNSSGRYQKLKAPPFSLITRLELVEDDGSWTIEERFYPIVSDNILTGYKCRPVDENEARTVQNLLFMHSRELRRTMALQKDRRGFYFAYKPRAGRRNVQI